MTNLKTTGVTPIQPIHNISTKKPAATAGFKGTHQVTPKKVVLTEEQKEVQRMIIMQTQDRKFAPVEDSEYQKVVTYVSAGNGMFRVRKTPVALFITKEHSNGVPGLPDMEEGVRLLIPKIPFKYIHQIITFYRDVNAKDKTEACANFYWNDRNVAIPNYDGLTVDGQLVMFVPFQRNSGAQTDFESGYHTRGEEVDWMRENLTPLLETHSHNTMDAFWSGTDNANETRPQFYLVLGHIASEKIHLEFRWCEGPNKQKINTTELIEWPQMEYSETTRKIKETKVTLLGGATEYSTSAVLSGLSEDNSVTQTEEESDTKTSTVDYMGPFSDAEYPETWLTVQHGKQAYTAPTYPRYGTGYPYAKKGTPVYEQGQLTIDGSNGWDDWEEQWGEPTNLYRKQSKPLAQKNRAELIAKQEAFLNLLKNDKLKISLDEQGPESDNSEISELLDELKNVITKVLLEDEGYTFSRVLVEIVDDLQESDIEDDLLSLDLGDGLPL